MVRYAGGAVDQVVTRWPEIVPSRTMPSEIWSRAGLGHRLRCRGRRHPRKPDWQMCWLPKCRSWWMRTRSPWFRLMRTFGRWFETGPAHPFTPHGRIPRLGEIHPGGRLAAVRRLAADLDRSCCSGGRHRDRRAKWLAVVSASGPPDLATAGNCGDVRSGPIVPGGRRTTLSTAPIWPGSPGRGLSSRRGCATGMPLAVGPS